MGYQNARGLGSILKSCCLHHVSATGPAEQFFDRPAPGGRVQPEHLALLTPSGRAGHAPRLPQPERFGDLCRLATVEHGFTLALAPRELLPTLDGGRFTDGGGRSEHSVVSIAVPGGVGGTVLAVEFGHEVVQ